MKTKILAIIFSVFPIVIPCDVFAEFNDYADNDYDYKDVCPGGGYVYNKCVDNNKDGVYDNRPCDGWSNLYGGFYIDRWSFAQCNCTSYTAYRIDSQLRQSTSNDLSFDNGYLGRRWGHGKDWDDAARKVGVSVDSIPIPGDIAYWDAGVGESQKYGHVAYVEHVTYDEDMNWTEICLSEYNITPEDYSPRCFKRGADGWLKNPSGFIHILAYNECPTSYYFNRYDAYDSHPEQTQDEWGKIFLIVWSKYRKEGNADSCGDYSGYLTWNDFGGFPSGFGGGGNPGTSTPPTDPPASGKLPDFITSKVAMGNQSGSKEKYTWKINETAYVHDYIDNIGTADWEGSAKKIKVAFYLSKGTKEDLHSEWVHVGERQEIKKEHLKIGDSKHKKIEFKLQDYADNGTVMPGRTYNFVVCADRPKDQDNGDGDVKEKHKSNNCSTEAVFYVDYGPPRNVDLTASNLALTGGRSQLQAGEKYGLQVEIANIGTERPWNGFSSSYEIKGPGTGGVWQRIGEDTSRASSLYPNAIHFESMSSEQEVAAPMVGGDYLFRACADYTQSVPETDESNNCTDELPVYVAPPPAPDLTANSLQLKSGSTILNGGSLYGLSLNVQNIGQLPAGKNFQISYEINGPETGGAWKLIADSTFTAVPLDAGADQPYSTNDSFAAAPTTEGDYMLRACVDSSSAIAESEEGNNCTESTAYVSPSSNPSLKPVYRFWSDSYQAHFYTISESEKDGVIKNDPNWRYEGIAYYAYPSQEDSSSPVYRFWSDNYQTHFYTISESEKDNVEKNDPNWRYEGIAWYAYETQYSGTVPVYRFWSDSYQAHFYTISETERDNVIKNDPNWRYEGIAWYVYPSP